MAENRPDSPDVPPPKKVASRTGAIVATLQAALRDLLADPFRLVLILAANVSVVVGIVSTAVILRNHKPPPKPITLAMALSALDADKTADARRMAERLAARKNIRSEEWGGPDFIFGTLAARAAEKTIGKQRTESYRVASLYLTRSHERGFPEHRESAGLYLLGKCLYFCGRLEDALPVLEQALQQNANPPAEIRLLLVDALLAVQPPELEKALAETQKLLSDRKLVDPQRRQALVQQAQALLRMNRGKECAATLDKVADNPLLRSDVLLLRGRLALSEGQALKKAAGPNEIPKAAKEKFHTAIELFRKAMSEDLGDNRAARQGTYLMGLCLMEQGDLSAALNQMERTSRFFPDTPESFAALYHQGELARRMGFHAEAVTAYQRLMSAGARQDVSHNPWVNLTQLKLALSGVCLDYLKAEKYETAVLLSKSLTHLGSKVEGLQLTAQIYLTWGENLMEQAEHLPPDRAEQRRKQARVQLRRAGDSYTDVAREMYTSRQYPDQLWNSANAYFAGHDFRNAAAMLRLYMHHEARLRHAQALIDLGEAELSLGNTERALQSFHECIEQHPRDVAIYRARLLASRAAINSGDLKQAESFLQDNLNGEHLTPASKEWRDSLFALAELLHNCGRHREAIQRLEESLQRYPDAPQATTARYLLADSSRRRAVELRANMSKEISSAVRGKRASESLRLLQGALEAYGVLQDNLSRRDAEDLTAQEKAILRNCRFAIGDTCFELERYPEALRAYQSAANHYATCPEVLDAYLQIANVYRRMDRPAEARTSLEQARLALRRIPADARFEQSTNYNRTQWGALLDRLCSL